MTPVRMATMLNRYWGEIEKWPEGHDDHSVWLQVEDLFIAFLPNVPCNQVPDGNLLHATIKRMKQGVAGVDGWTVREIKLLPKQAWETITRLFRRWFTNPYGPPTATPVMRKRRTPIQKRPDAPGLPDVSAVRPIDVHSTIARAYSTCLAAQVKPWLKSITHPTQAASHTGILPALSKIALWTELATNAIGDIFAVSLDLTKMYNMISPVIAKKMAVAAGMSELTANLLAGPLEWADHIWRLPRDAPNTPKPCQRGVSQGMSASIVFSEVVMAALVRKLHLVIPCDTVCYIDDLHVITTSLAFLDKAMNVISQFTHVFHLVLASAKSGLWGSKPTHLVDLSNRTGIPIVTSITALGGQWQVARSPVPTFDMDRERVRLVEERLMRVPHLPAHPSVRAQATCVACLPKIDYLPAPAANIYTPLRAKVRRAIGLTSGAPEIIYNIPSGAVLDPPERLFLGLLRLWFFCVRLPRFESFLRLRNPAASKGRLGHFLRLCRKRNCEVTTEDITFRAHPGDLTLRFAQGWPSLRGNVQTHLKNLAFLALQIRRPLAYGGVMQCDWKAHRRYHAALPAYQAVTIMRVWAGVAMTKAHAFTLKLDDTPECQCGLGPQDVYHILWICPQTQRNRPLDLMWWSRQPPALSRCLICPYGQSLHFQRQWKRVCAWALQVIPGISRHHSPDMISESYDDPILYRAESALHSDPK